MLGAYALDGIDDAALHLEKRLTAREPEGARTLLHRLPLFGLGGLLQLPARPLADVELEQALVVLDAEAVGLGDRCRRLARALEWRRVDGVQLRQGGDAVGDALGLLAPVVGEMKPLGATREELAGRRRVAVPDEKDEGWLGAGARGHERAIRTLPSSGGLSRAPHRRHRRLLQVSAARRVARAGRNREACRLPRRGVLGSARARIR